MGCGKRSRESQNQFQRPVQGSVEKHNENNKERINEVFQIERVQWSPRKDEEQANKARPVSDQFPSENKGPSRESEIPSPKVQRTFSVLCYNSRNCIENSIDERTKAKGTSDGGFVREEKRELDWFGNEMPVRFGQSEARQRQWLVPCERLASKVFSVVKYTLATSAAL